MELFQKQLPEEGVPLRSRHPWSKEEDNFLIQSVGTCGVGHWSNVAASLKEHTGIPRTAKQCRNRWINCLDPAVTKQEWTAEEEELIVELHRQYGNKWADIAKHLSGRTDNSVKNHWYSTLRKKLRKLYKLIGDEFNKDPKLKQQAIEFLRIDYRKYMTSKNMKKSDIVIVCHCIDYMQLLDIRGELGSKDGDQNKLMAGYPSFVDSLYPAAISPDNFEIYDNFILSILQRYQDLKQIHIPYAPDVHYSSIKRNDCVGDEENITSSPFTDNSKFTGALANLPSIHHSRAKRPRRSAEESTIPMVPSMVDMYDTAMLSSTAPIMTMQMLPQSGLHGLGVIPSMSMQTVQVQSMPMQIIPQMQILPQMQVIPEQMAETQPEGQPELSAIPTERESEVTVKAEVGSTVMISTPLQMNPTEPERTGTFPLNPSPDENNEIGNKRPADIYM